MKQGSGLNKKFAQFILILFSFTSFVIILLQAFKFGYGLNREMTISQYVGLAPWSAVTFLVSNLAIVIVWLKYVGQVKRKFRMSKLWYVLAVLVTLFLVVLSFCPIGLFDEVPGQYGLVSNVHRFSSTAMFVLMLITTVGLFIKVEEKWFRVVTLAYIVYGIVVAFLYILLAPCFVQNELPIEVVYILSYLVILCILPRRVV